MTIVPDQTSNTFATGRSDHQLYNTPPTTTDGRVKLGWLIEQACETAVCELLGRRMPKGEDDYAPPGGWGPTVPMASIGPYWWLADGVARMLLGMCAKSHGTNYTTDKCQLIGWPGCGRCGERVEPAFVAVVAEIEDGGERWLEYTLQAVEGALDLREVADAYQPDRADRVLETRMHVRFRVRRR